MASSSMKNVFEFKISLKYIKPKIWRRIQVPANYTFQQLHWAIQDSMGWQSNFGNYHLHVFRLKRPSSGEKIEIGMPNDMNDFIETIPEERAKLKDYFIVPKTKALYEYDFGDGWEHEVVLEKILPAVEGTPYPKCIAGKRACPPEDCGGYEGYEEHLKIIRNPRHPEYKERIEWLESKTVGPNPEEFQPSTVIFNEDNLLQARKKLKAAESESELFTEQEEYPLKRKRKPCKRFSFSSDEVSDEDNPLSEDICQLKIPRLADNLVQQQNSFPELREPFDKLSKAFIATQAVNSPGTTQSGLLENYTGGTPAARPLGGRVQESDALNNIARVLAKIERRLSDVEKTQQEILQILSPNHVSPIVPLSEIKLPCDSIEDVNKLEEWLANEENEKALMVNLSILGGRNIPCTVRAILEKIFSNKVAHFFNWTGRFSKCPLKDLNITRIIPGIVRRNKKSVAATNSEIYEVMTNWFRYCKDRDGGRSLRIKDTIL